MDRRSFVSLCAVAGTSATFADALWNQASAAVPPAAAANRKAPTETLAEAPTEAQQPLRITRDMIIGAEALAGVRYTEPQRQQLIERLESQLASFMNIRLIDIPNDVPPPFRFSPRLPGTKTSVSTRRAGGRTHVRPVIQRPATPSAIAFLTVLELAELIRTRRLTSMELTRICLDRLRRFNPMLRCVVNLTPELALRQAATADREIAEGKYRGPLHGIPYGVKDILSVPGYPTTWGAAVYEKRVLNNTATVVERLNAAGAVLLAKLSLGELGLADTWFGGQTMNPWRPTEGAFGSSAGSAVAVSAGLLPFTIGAETMGSMVIPAARNGVTALRPTFGRVSRHGAMSLCWSLDKIGPFARDVEDCAVVLEAIAGPDGKDDSVADVPFQWDPDRSLSSIRVGYFKLPFDLPHTDKARDDAALASLRRIGVQPVVIEFPSDLPINSALLVRVEAAAALEEVARVHGLDSLSVQGDTGWPNFMRASQFVSAVDYLQASRMRTMLMQRMERIFASVDVFMSPTSSVMPVTNLTGNPAVVMPSGMTQDGLPTSISLIGRLYGEAALCTVAKAWQQATGYHLQHPRAFV